MQLFRSEEDVESWAAHRGRPVGATFSLQTLCRLASRWYDDRLELHWARKPVGERRRILTEVGLEGDFWRLE